MYKEVRLIMLNIDTQKVKSCGEDMFKLSKNLEDLINGLYVRIHNMPTKTYEWVGASAELFVKQSDEIEYRDALIFKNTLKEIAEKLISSAEKYEIENIKNK